MQPNAGTNQLSSRRTVLRLTKRLPKWQTLRLNTASLLSHWLRLRRDEQRYRAERSRTAYLQLGFASWQKTRDYSLSGDLFGRARRLFLHFSNCFSANGRSSVASNEEMPETIRFRVGVSKLGEIRYCFPVNSSGDSALDEQARLYVAHCRFSQNTANAGKADSFLAWGTATIVWGNDIARPQPARAASVTQ